MSGILVVVDRDSGPEPGLVRDLLDILGHRGPDGQGFRVSGGVAVGHQRFWTTPEEVGEEQPLASPDGHVLVALDGRIDNRSELIDALGAEAEPGRPPSDASLVLLAYERWGADAVRRLLGSFAIAIADERRQTILLARDALGERSVFYWTDGRRFVAASEEVAVLAHPSVSSEPDHERIATFFKPGIPRPGSTFYRHVREVPSAHLLVLDREGIRLRRHWEPQVVRVEGRSSRTDEIWAAEFVARLDEAVRCRLRCVGPPAVLLSGGLDSGPIAALAARSLAPEPLTAFSWVFDELPGCDERPYIGDVVERWRLRSIFTRCDDASPMADLATWRVDPNGPQEDPYRVQVDRGYEAARQSGSRILLAGFGGDQLYADSGSWFVDLVREGRVREAVRGFLEIAGKSGLPHAARSLVLSPLLPRALRRWAPSAPGPWLTPYSRQLLRGRDGEGDDAGPARRPRQRLAITNDWTASRLAAESRNASRAGVEVRNPFRDPQVVELALSLPAYLLQRDSTTRPVVRLGFRDLLPASVLNRNGKTSFQPLLDRTLSGSTSTVFRGLLSRNGGLRSLFVEDDWIAAATTRVGLEEIERLVLWQCACFDLWSTQMLG